MLQPFRQLNVGDVFEMNGFTYMKTSRYAARRYSSLTDEFYGNEFSVDGKTMVRLLA